MADWVTKELGFIVEIESQQIAPTAFPDEIFSHYSLPAFDAIGGPLAQAGRHIESRKFRLVQSAVLVSKLNPRKMRVQAFEFTGERRAVASTEFMVYVPRVDDLNLISQVWSRGYLQIYWLHHRHRSSWTSELQEWRRHRRISRTRRYFRRQSFCRRLRSNGGSQRLLTRLTKPSKPPKT